MRIAALSGSYSPRPVQFVGSPTSFRRRGRTVSGSDLALRCIKARCRVRDTAYCEAFEMQSWIYRFVSILGERYTHGHVFDFCKQLIEQPES